MKQEICNDIGLGQRNVHPFFLTSMREITKPNISIEEIEMEQLIEKIKPIKGYEGLYSISNYGYVISEAKKWMSGFGIRKKERTVLKASINRDGYLSVKLCKDGKTKNHMIHLLVYDHFGEGKRNSRILQVDHLNNDKLNPRIDNLQLLSCRANISKGHICRGKKTSRYTGVYWNKNKNKWVSKIRINKIPVRLGCFTDEYEANLAYQKRLKEII